jgi:lipoprotein-anchoring transpeptidase ErfK/SrfK
LGGANQLPIECTPGADDNGGMGGGSKSAVARPLGNIALAGVVLLAVFVAPALAQQRLQPAADFQSTMQDVPPGVDHGNVSDDLPEEFQRQAVFYRSQLPVGTVIVETAERHLYLIESETRALRYGIGVGRDAAKAAGLMRVSRKAEWPDWTAPADLVARLPYVPRFVAGGPGNPLGARVMDLGNAVYRIHGTNAPETIGQFLLIGCFRLVNDDVTDLYDRVNVGTRVIVRQN